MDVKLENFLEITKSRRSVRIFKETKIDPSVIQTCIDMALLAPNSSNLQPWSIYWVKTPDVKNNLIKACMNQPAAKTAAELLVFVSRTDTWDLNRKKMLEVLKKSENVSTQALFYYEKLVPFIYKIGFLGWFGYLKKIYFFIKGLFSPILREPTTSAEMLTWATKSTSLACENFMLAVKAHSFDTCPMEGFDSHRIKRLLNLSKHSYVTMVIAVGERAENGVYGPQIRFERDNFVKEV